MSRTDASTLTTACDREQIHVSGHIQPAGFLIAVSTDWMIQHVSANIGDHLDVVADDLPGLNLDVILPKTAIASIKGRLRLLASYDGTERLFGCDLLGTNTPFDVAVHVAGPSIIIEAEPTTTGREVTPGALVKSMVTRIQQTQGLGALFRESVRQLRAITGYDRVMLYRFADDGSGEVVAESMAEGQEPYLGLHYPATDIPQQARALYIRNQTRGIWDVAAVPVPIIPAINPYGQPLDLSLSVLRSVSPVHIQYLKNMGVAASYSVSIVISGRLWGLFALHHRVGRHLEMEVREATELFGQMVSFIIEGRIHDERRLSEERAREMHDRLIGKIVASTGSIAALAEFSEDLREIIACDGLTVWSKGEGHSTGLVPPVGELEALSRFLNRAAAGRVYSTNRLAAMHPPATAYRDTATGVLAIPISRAPRDYVLFFRREHIDTVTWAGDPNAKRPGDGASSLTPRHSFAAWKETVRGRSRPFTLSEEKAAEGLRVSILEILLRFSEESERERTKFVERQELLIAELNHRVRNILGLMRAIVAQSRPGAATIDDFSRIIGGRIKALARAHDQITSDDTGTISLKGIIETEVQAFVGEKASRVHLDGPDLRVEAKAFSTLALVFHELVTNSAKYGALCDSHGSIVVKWQVGTDGSCALSWRETGGPVVMEPTRRGFGTTIIERAIPHELFGTSDISYRPSGVEVDFVLPQGVFHLVSKEFEEMQPLQPLALSSTAFDAVAPPEPSLAGRRGLIVEDNMIIALDAEQLLFDSGMTEIFLASSVAEARKIIAKEALDIALLDVNLGIETSFALIDDLNGCNVPYVFVTGYGERIELPPAAGEAEAIKKPFASDLLLKAIKRAMSRKMTG